MSSGKDCGHHKRKFYRRVLAALVVFIIISIILVILVVWLILRPTKPHFVLQDATVFSFILSSQNILTTTLQITLASRNPNERIGIYYDKVHVYGSYHGQQITLPTQLPANYQGHKEVTVWSPFVYGNAVPVAPSLAASFYEDQVAGTVLVNVRVDGRIRWRVGTFISGRYRLFVNCPAYISYYGSKSNGVAVGVGVGVGEAAVKYQLLMDCHVEV